MSNIPPGEKLRTPHGKWEKREKDEWEEKWEKSETKHQKRVGEKPEEDNNI